MKFRVWERTNFRQCAEEISFLFPRDIPFKWIETRFRLYFWVLDAAYIKTDSRSVAQRIVRKYLIRYVADYLNVSEDLAEMILELRILPPIKEENIKN